MPVTYNVQAAIINEGHSKIERYAAKIVKVANCSDEDYIKTFPLLTDPKNLAHQESLRDDLYGIQRENFLGISFISYGVVSFIHFMSTFRMFQLEKGDSITLYFENGEAMDFSFQFPKTPDGYTFKNIHPITDDELKKLRSTNLLWWKLTNSKSQVLVGGFTYNERNKQYKSARTGQKIMRLMAENILETKKQLIKR